MKTSWNFLFLMIMGCAIFIYRYALFYFFLFESISFICYNLYNKAIILRKGEDMEPLNSFLSTVLCFASFFIAFFGVSQGPVLIIRMLTFTLPFSKKLTEQRVYDRSVHKRMILTEWVKHIVFIAVSIVLALLMVTFGDIRSLVALIAGFVLGLIYSLVINTAAIGFTPYNIKGFRKAQSRRMNMERFEHVVRRMEDKRG
jgi:hypothetical protein